MGGQVKEEEMEVKSPPVLETITWTSVFALNDKKKNHWRIPNRESMICYIFPKDPSSSVWRIGFKRVTWKQDQWLWKVHAKSDLANNFSLFLQDYDKRQVDMKALIKIY